jgi:hypothetical protein
MSATLDQAHELEKVLINHGISVFGYERAGDLAIVRFDYDEVKYRLVVPMPDWNDDKYVYTEARHDARSITARRQMYWKDVAATWRAMKNLISAKLEGIEAQITTVEAEFNQFRDGVAALGTGDAG